MTITEIRQKQDLHERERNERTNFSDFFNSSVVWPGSLACNGF